MKKIRIYSLIGFVLFSCSSEPEIEINEPLHPEPPVKIINLKNDEQFVIGDEIVFDLVVSDPTKVKDLELYKSALKKENQSFKIGTKKARVGFTKIAITYADEKGDRHGDTRTVVLFSDIVPKAKVAKIVGTYPHDKSSYTQGLEFYKGKLFEGTGQYGKSILAEVDLKSGKHLRKHVLDAQYFGEGITILNDTIYQISYTEHTCIVYNMNFEKIKEYSYSGEGWGLCNNGKSLIMSNGSNEIVWRNPRSFAIEKSIYVFNDQSDIGQLNELELINGRLFVNVYTDDRILEVDTTTGKVLSDIDCSEVVLDGRVPGADVLNGIAYNPVTRKIYITGKWWPKLYEVTFN